MSWGIGSVRRLGWKHSKPGLNLVLLFDDQGCTCTLDMGLGWRTGFWFLV